MAIVNFTGAELGAALEAAVAGSNATIDSTVKRTGGYSYKFAPTAGQTSNITLQKMGADGVGTTFNQASLYATIYLYVETAPASARAIAIIRASGANYQVEVDLDSGPALTLFYYNNLGVKTAIGSASSNLSLNTWYRITLIATALATGGSSTAELKLNGTSVASATALTILGTPANCNVILLGAPVDTVACTVYMDDICVDSAADPGAGQIFRMDADGNGNYTAWTGAYTDVDEVPHDSDTTYITSATSGDAETVTLESGAAAGLVGTPLSIKSCGVVRDEGGVSAIQIRLRSASTDDDTTSAQIGAAYSATNALYKIYNTDPATGLAWVASALDSLEVGVDNAASVAVRCTALYVTVWEDGVAVGGVGIRRLNLLGVGM